MQQLICLVDLHAAAIRLRDPVAGASMIRKKHCPVWVVRFILRVAPHIFETQVFWA